MKIKKNDMVKVISGNYSGKTGKVLKVIPETDRVIVEKVNLIKRHAREEAQGQGGGIIEKEAPIARSNVILICPKCNRPARTGIAWLADNRKVRKCKKCGETLSDED